MSSAFDGTEFEFAHKVRRVLDASAAELPEATVSRLAAARRAALARKKPEAAAQPVFVLAPAGMASGQQRPGSAGTPRRLGGLRGLRAWWPVLALAGGIMGIAYWQNDRHAAEVADIDAAMLSDNLPISAYLDHGFHAYLSHSQ